MDLGAFGRALSRYDVVFPKAKAFQRKTEVMFKEHLLILEYLNSVSQVGKRYVAPLSDQGKMAVVPVALGVTCLWREEYPVLNVACWRLALRNDGPEEKHVFIIVTLCPIRVLREEILQIEELPSSICIVLNEIEGCDSEPPRAP